MNSIKIICTSLVTLTLHAHDLVDVKKLCPTIVYDIRYATTNNFTGKQIYSTPGCYLHQDAVIALKKVVNELAQDDLGIKIFDAYRPLSAQWILWKAHPDPKYVADPRKGGRHTRGTSIDLTLIRLSDGTDLEMPTEFDCPEEKASSTYQALPPLVIANRTKLQHVMRKHGFTTIASEWWHFDFKNFRNYPSLDITFEALT